MKTSQRLISIRCVPSVEYEPYVTCKLEQVCWTVHSELLDDFVSLHSNQHQIDTYMNETTMIWSFATRRQIDVPLAEEFRDVPDVFNELVLRLLPRYSRSERMCQNLFTPQQDCLFHIILNIVQRAHYLLQPPLGPHQLLLKQVHSEGVNFGIVEPPKMFFLA